jgi:heat shock protein HtpX
MLLILLLSAIGYLITMLMRFAISRKREYMADAGSAEMTHKPLALASALRKISVDSRIEAVEQKDVAQLFIDNPLKKGIKGVGNLFATHPPIDKRIKILEQF